MMFAKSKTAKHKPHKPRMSMAQTWQMLNAINRENIGDAPWWVQALVLILMACVILAAAWAFAIAPVRSDTAALGHEEQILLDNYASAFTKARTLPFVKSQFAEQQAQFATLTAQLPERTHTAQLTQEIHLAAVSAGVRIIDVAVGSTSEQTLYVMQPVRLTVEGEYGQVVRLLRALSELPQLVTLDDFTLANQAEIYATPMLKLTLTLHAYRAKTVNADDKTADGAADKVVQS
ncbi:hypothetical protein B0181_09115 [Moraxella caviae]|uniref:Pilus assembly protein, PilO n=1 Tax=Moraxella caviae TaxID=34060 RepID=A0A1S9ZX30_9GAMM|nr:type 4a pilus biogenesis protein PilO [Moraxella caviae]OOR88096.1 hypothetical protein B0181_09115 [Moraxella caviae]STZ09958.1 Pilus assembly protein, PilO [Moraxella caviae]VEW11236.1 Pilus assembly protein, PilO [Moraxella caviae]